MGTVQMGVPKTLIINLLEKSNVQVFVESGTHYGNTSMWASQKFKLDYHLKQLQSKLLEHKSSLKQIHAKIEKFK